LLLLCALFSPPRSSLASDPAGESLAGAILPSDNGATVGRPGEEGGRGSDAPPRDDDLPLTLATHRQNYLLPAVYNRHPNDAVFNDSGMAGGGTEDIRKWEAKFQLSVKYLVVEELFHPRLSLYFGYTNLSYWQVYNRALSRPFRDTNHEPEAWLQLDADRDAGAGIRVRHVRLGAWHHSNGRSEPLSRSWNRIFASVLLAKGDLAVSLKPWWRIPENEEDDDNPDIEKFYGYGELEASWRAGGHRFSCLWRNNLRMRGGNKGAVQLGWNFPLRKQLTGYVQYFNGYGQTILDYDHSANALGVGISLSPPL
jgi:phospholipase A1